MPRPHQIATGEDALAMTRGEGKPAGRRGEPGRADT
jgi:hypothetical protein